MNRTYGNSQIRFTDSNLWKFSNRRVRSRTHGMHHGRARSHSARYCGRFGRCSCCCWMEHTGRPPAAAAILFAVGFKQCVLIRSPFATRSAPAAVVVVCFDTPIFFPWMCLIAANYSHTRPIWYKLQVNIDMNCTHTNPPLAVARQETEVYFC